MKKALLLIFFVFLFFPKDIFCAKVDTNSATIKLARMFGKEIFDLNGVKYLQPLVEALNATSNSRFFNQAYVPKSVKKPYFRVGLHIMTGFVSSDMKTYNPVIPNEAMPNDFNAIIAQLNKYGNFSNILNPVITDTVGLEYYALKTLISDGIKKGMIKVPPNAATVLGNQKTEFWIRHSTVDSLIKMNPAFAFLPKALQDTILSNIMKFPELFTLPPGANMNTIVAGVPQVEIGSLFGTELLLRGLPEIDMGPNIGHFAFWGVGLKHSISQYFEKFPVDIAVQVVYQGTKLRNKIGVTNTDLKATATFWDFNFHASKRFYNMWDVYTGFSYETLSLHSDFTYKIPVETQNQLGLLRKDTVNGKDVIMPPEPPDYPGDNQPQTTSISMSNSNFKWVIGTAVQLGPVVIFADFNLSKFNIFTGGLEFRF